MSIFPHPVPSFRLCLVAVALAVITVSSLEAKREVVAHYMLNAQSTYGQTMQGYMRDIEDALAYDVDGFGLNIFDSHAGSAYLRNVDSMFAAVERVPAARGFVLYYSFSQRKHDVDSIVAAVAKYARHPNYFRIDGRPVFTTFTVRDDRRPPEFWTDVKRRLRDEHKIEAFFAPFFQTGREDGETVEDALLKVAGPHLDAMDGFTMFSAGTLPFPPRAGASWNASSALRGEETARFFKSRGKLYCAAVTPNYVTVRRGKEMPVRLYQGGIGLEAGWRSVIERQDADFVKLTTWNDVGESSHFSPAEQPPAFYRNKFPAYSHRAYAELNRYFIRWYKTGVPPEITAEQLFYFYRTHPHEIRIPATDRLAQAGELKVTGETSDVIYITTLLRAPAVLKVRSGGAPLFERDVAAGLQHVKVPFAEGRQQFELWRDGRKVAGKVGEEEITASPQTRRYDYFSGFVTVSN